MRRFSGIFFVSIGMLALTLGLWVGAFVLQAYRCAGFEEDLGLRIGTCNWIIEVAESNPFFSPVSAAMWDVKGSISYNLGDRQKALEEFEKAKMDDPEFGQVRRNLGQVYLELGRFEDALREFHQAVLLEPEDHYSYLHRADALRELGRFDQAIADYSKGIELNPELALPYNSRGWILLRLGAQKRALMDFNKAIDIDPLCANAFYNRGRIFFSSGDIENATANYERARLLKPGKSWIWYGDEIDVIKGG